MMSWKDHKNMLILSVLIVILTISVTMAMLFANAALAQWRVDINVARQELAERVLKDE